MQISLHNNFFDGSTLKSLEKKISKYSEKLLSSAQKNEYLIHESSLAISGDAAYQRAIAKALIPFRGVSHVVLVGIGGSSLGTEAVYHALKTDSSPTLTVLDTIDAESITQWSAILRKCKDPAQIVVVVISKSGSTTETITNASKVIEMGENKFGDAFCKHVIFVADKESEFYKVGKKKKILCFSFPSIIGGRYSVFTAVGMVPLTLLGIDIQALRDGANASCTKEEVSATASRAATLALHAAEGFHTVNLFTFNERLHTIGLWYRQLLAESVGKQTTKKRAPFAHPLLPIVSTKADLHSMTELYLGGYKNMYTHFLSYPENKSFSVSGSHWLVNHMPFLKEKRSNAINDAIKTGVIQAYEDQKLPYRITEMESLSAYEVGKLLNALMIEVMCLAYALDIDPFNQPSVELYKKHTRATLNS